MNSQATIAAQAPRAWYREPWPWILIALPLTAVVFSLYAAFLSWHGADTVIDQDYYRKGLAINDELARAQRAEAMGLGVALDAQGLQAGDAVVLRLTSTQGDVADPAITLRLMHPTRPSADRVVLLARRPGDAGVGGAEYVGTWQPTEKIASAVAWRVVVDGRDWRLEGDGPDTAGAIVNATITAHH